MLDLVDLEYDNFDWNSYVSNYEDLKIDNINTKEKAWKHWTSHGKNEGRLYFDKNENIKTNDFKEEINNNEKQYVVPIDEKFNWVKYIDYYQDLKNDNINTKEKAWNHWIKYGEKEGRNYFSIDSNIDFNKNDEYINFDWEMYLQFYEDLQHKTNDKSVAWEHWDKHGKKENRIYFDLSMSFYYKNFDWKFYTSNYDDLKHITTKEVALKHWLNFGMNEERTFINTNTSKIFGYNFEDLFFINLTCHYLSKKYEINFDYKHYDLFKKFGIVLFTGKNTYSSNFILTNENFFDSIKNINENSMNELVNKNIILSKDIHCITKDYCLLLKKTFYESSDNQNKITQSNLFKERYLSNKDLYIYIYIDSLDEIYIRQLFEYYNESIKKIKYDKIYVSSNNINHEVCKNLIEIYNMTIDEKEICEKIMFANTCKFLILSCDVTSLLIGFFNFFSKHIYYPVFTNSKYSEIFESFGWKGTNISKLNIKPRLNPPPLIPIKVNNQAKSPTDEWYDSPFIRPKPTQTKPTETKQPTLKIKLQEDDGSYYSTHINFDKF
jgi:hypothetical protein